MVAVFGGKYGSVGRNKMILVVWFPQDEIRGLLSLDLAGSRAN